MDCYQGLKLTHILFFGGLGLPWFGLIVGAMGNWTSVLIVCGVVGVICSIAGLFCGLAYVRCPKCGGPLMAGGRVPTALPNYCPHCGKQL